jgi:hypothetical protein
VHDHQVVGNGEHRRQQIVHTYRPMPAPAGQLTLCVQCRLPVFVVGWQVFVGQAPVVPQLLVLVGTARAVQRFGIERRRRRHHAALDQRRDALGDIRIGHPGPSARVDQKAGCYRHT